MKVEVESKQQLSQIETDELERSLQLEIKSVIVFTPQVEVLPPNTIIQEGLKAKRVIDNRKKD